MIYRSNDTPQAYNKIAEISDNYIVWVRESTLQSGTNYSAYIQYLSPSICGFLIEDYKITAGTSYTLDANYINNGMYSYIDSYDVEFTMDTYSPNVDDFSVNDFDRGDMPLIFICQFICCILFVWMLNQCSKLFKKDGVFH